MGIPSEAGRGGSKGCGGFCLPYATASPAPHTATHLYVLAGPGMNVTGIPKVQEPPGDRGQQRAEACPKPTLVARTGYLAALPSGFAT